jgi:hypothetical protein
MAQVQIIPSSERRRYACDIIEVHSGDDLIALVDLEIDGLYKKTRLRLSGVDTPDAYQKAVDTPAGKIREAVRRYTVGNHCYIDVHSQGRGGWKVTLWVESADDPNLLNLNQVLIEEGYIFRPK